MAASTFSGPVRAGTVREGASRNVGYVVLAQIYDSGNITGNIVGNVDTAAFILPAGSQIVDIQVDQSVASLTGTTTVSVGTTSGGAQLMAGVVTTAGGRFRGTLSAATQLAWITSATADTTVYIRNATGVDT